MGVVWVWPNSQLVIVAHMRWGSKIDAGGPEILMCMALHIIHKHEFSLHCNGYCNYEVAQNKWAL